MIHRRYETPEPGQFSPSSLHLDSASPSTEYIDGSRGLTWRQLDAGQFFVGRRVQGTVNGVATTFTRSYAGCKAIDAERITGCFASCRIMGDGTRTVQTGTFEALNVRRPEGEPEASGMSLLANAKVEVLGQPGTPFGLPADVYVTKNRAYVVSLDWSYVGEGGLTVFDVSNPAAPVITAQVPSNGGYWNGVWAKGDALYVASAEAGVVTFDISNPDAPTLETATQVSEAGLNVHTVFVRDDVLYAMAPRPVVGGEVIFYDVKDPLAPKLLGRHTIADAAGVTGAYPHDAFVYEGKMYVNYWSAGYQVLDVSDPKNPVSLGAYTYPNATSHANAVGRYGARTIAFEGGEDWSAHLRVLDVTDPAKIRKIGEYARRTGPSIHNMVLSEEKQRLYVAHYQEGVRVLDVSQAGEPDGARALRHLRAERRDPRDELLRRRDRHPRAGRRPDLRDRHEPGPVHLPRAVDDEATPPARAGEHPGARSAPAQGPEAERRGERGCAPLASARASGVRHLRSSRAASASAGSTPLS